MRYFGSKTSTLETLSGLISSKVKYGTFCDPFGGIGCVSSLFLKNGYQVYSGDYLLFPHYFQIARLRVKHKYFFKNIYSKFGLKNFQDIELYLNSLPPKDGWFVKEYSKNRSYFTVENAKSIQAVRMCLKQWRKDGLLTYDENATLLASLINSFDKVANTAGTYYAYLKSFVRKSEMRFVFKIIEPVDSENVGNCFRGNALDLIRERPYDILYLDPPYNKRSYAHYYHLPETIAKGTTPKVFGQSGIPKLNINCSEFNSKSKASSQLELILKESNFKLLIFHYADDGLISPVELKKIFEKYDKVEECYIVSKGYTAKPLKRNIKHHIYIVDNAKEIA